MEEPTEATHSDGDIVWVKLGSCWWPGQVCGFDKLPPGLLKSFRKQPIAVVKFFQEESFEYVKNDNFIFKYNCSRKHEFIRKGLDLFRSKHSHMDKFPEDVCTAERLTDGNPDIITDDEFLPKKKESYANIFGSPNDSNQNKKTPGKRGRPAASPVKWKIKNTKSPSSNNTPKITHPRILQKYLKGTSDYKAHILVQPRNSLDSLDSPDTLNISAEDETYISPKRTKTSSAEESPDKATGGAGTYSCHACNFTSTRLNVMILHNKSHSAGYVSYTPVKKPVSKSPLLKTKAKSETFADDESSDFVDKKKKASKPKGRPKSILDTSTKTPPSPSKSRNKEKPLSPPKRKMKTKEKEAKKPKTDVEIKNSLLADWNEDSDEESMDILTSLKLTENQNSSSLLEKKTSITDDGSPTKSEINTPEKTDDALTKENSKTEKRDQTSCFDFEEDEDLEIEKIGRKIPRVSSKSEDSKKISEPIIESECSAPVTSVSDDKKVEAAESQIDPADLDSEVDNLLKETAVPELPTSLTESNFQKSKVVKVPDKDGDSQYIFKTKTFFRSRHSRGQDAIEKYVADNTIVDKPITYMDGSIDTDKNSSEAEDISKNDLDDSSKDALKSESVKVTKFAPKIQLKKMKAALDMNKWTSENKSVEDSSNVSNTEDVLIKKESDNLDKTQSKPSESDLQIAETLINLPKTAHEITSDCQTPKSQEIVDASNQSSNKIVTNLNVDDTSNKSIINLRITRSRNTGAVISVSNPSIQSSDPHGDSSNMFHMLDDSNKSKSKQQAKNLQTKIIKSHVKEKILNFDVGSPSSRLRKGPEHDAIIIRRKTSPIKLNAFTSGTLNEASQELLMSSKTSKWNDDEVQTFTIEGSSGSNEDLLDPKLKKVTKSNLVKPHVSLESELIATSKEIKSTESSILDAKIKPSTPSTESSDSFLISQSPKRSSNTAEVVKSESALTPENLEKPSQSKKSDILSPKRPKIIVKSPIEKTVSPNILSKSVKTKTMKQLVIVDKNLGEKHLIMPQSDNSQSFQAIEGLVKETSNSSQQAQKKIIIDTSNLPIGKKTQKIILNTLPKGQVSASVISESGQSNIDVKQRVASISSDQLKAGEVPAGSSYMIITNAQGVQSKIVLSPEHHKLLFPKSKLAQQSNISAKTSASSPAKSKTQLVIGSDQIIMSEPISTLMNNDSQVLPISKPTTTLINSKGQIIMSGSGKRILSTTPGQAILTSKGQIIAPQSSTITSTSSLISNASKSSNVLSSKPIPTQKILRRVPEGSKPEKALTINTLSKVPTKTLINKGVNQNLSASYSQTRETSKKEKLIINPTKTIIKPSSHKSYGQTTTIIQAQIKDPKLYLAQKSGTITLTAAEFEHLQKTGQLVAKSVQHKVVEPPSKVPSSKVQNQKLILKKLPENKQIANDPAVKTSSLEVPMNKKKVELNTTTEISTVTPTNLEKSTLIKKQKPINTKSGSGYNCNNVNISEVEDTNSLENLDKLIPATIIPTRKRDSTVSTGASEKIKQTSEVADNMKDSGGDAQSLSANSLADPQKQLLAIPGENFGGPPNSFFLCVEENGTLTPIDNQPLVLENNQLVPMTMPSVTNISSTVDSEAVLMTPAELPNVKDAQAEPSQILELPVNQTQQNILINTGDQQLLVDQQTFLSLLSGNEQIVLPDGQHLVLQGGSHQFLNEEIARLFTDNQQALITPENSDTASTQSSQDVQSREDILAAALIGSEVLSDTLIHDNINVTTESGIIDMDSLSPNLQNVSTAVHSNVFETSSTLNQPIMSPLEHPSKSSDKTNSGLLAISKDSKINPKNLEDSLAVIGVATTNVPTSLELPITVTNPRIAAKTTSSSNTLYQSSLLTSTVVSSGITIFDSDINLTDSSSPKKQIIEAVVEKAESPLTKSDVEIKEDICSLQPDSVSENLIKDAVASSMPCLDEPNTDVPQIAEETQSKTYSPISMPILTDDPEVVTEEDESLESKKDNLIDTVEENIDTPEVSKSEVSSKDVEMEKLNESQVEKTDEESVIENVPENASDVSVKAVEENNEESMSCNNENSLESHKDREDKVESEIKDMNHTESSNHIEESKAEPHIPSPLPEPEPESVIEADEICVETPPDFTREQSPINYDEEPAIQNETEENSIPDHTCEVSSDVPTMPDSTVSSVETMSPTPEPPISSALFSESSSDASTEIPMQPEITVSHHLVQNFSSLLNNASLEEKSNDCASSDSKVSEEFDKSKEKNVDSCEVDGER